MIKYFLKNLIQESKKGALVGIGISLTFMLATNGIPLDIRIWLGFILFGALVGFFISFNLELVNRVLLTKYNLHISIQMIITYIISMSTFYIVAKPFVYLQDIPKQYLLYASLANGLISVMADLSFVVIKEKEEKIKLEQENKELAIIEERNRIARELHDSVSQNLFGINLNLNTLNHLLDTDPAKTKEIILQLQDMVGEVQTEMRLMIYELRPMALEKKNFFEALEDLINLFKLRYEININYYFTGSEEKLNNDEQIALYRIIQESLNNIVQHARATKTKVNLNLDEKTLVIEDNGQGFDTNQEYDGHFGIDGMKERVKGINGEFELKSTIGEGTTLTVKI